MNLLILGHSQIAEVADGLAGTILGDVSTFWSNEMSRLEGDEHWSSIISMFNTWKVPESLLGRADLALNIHCGTHEYPGSGGFRWAIYEDATTYGAVCHIMEPTIDTGPIVDHEYFDVSPDDTPYTLQARSQIAALTLFERTISKIAQGKKFDPYLQWSRQAFTRADLEKIAPDENLPPDELGRRMRAA